MTYIKLSFFYITVLLVNTIFGQSDFDSGKYLTMNIDNGFLGDEHFLDYDLNKHLANTFPRLQITSSDMLDSVIYTLSGATYKEIYSYSSAAKVLTSLKQISHGDWVNYSMSTFTYDDNENLLNELNENWDKVHSIWIKDNQKTSVYDDQGNKLTYLYEDWDISTEEWINDRRYTNSYDTSGNRLTYMRERWDTGSEIWQEDWTVLSTYDDNGNELTQLWEVVLVSWQDWFYTFTYDSSGRRLSYRREVREPYSTEWIYYWQYFYTYDIDGNLLVDQSESWDTYSSSWLQNTRYVFTYDSVGNLIEDISETPDYNTGLWKGSYRNFYTYNENRKRLSSFTEKWHIIDSVWVNNARTSYEYDDSDNLTYFFNENWSGLYWEAAHKTIAFEKNGGSFSFSCEELSAFYSPLTGLSEEKNSSLKSFTLSQNYPNPFNPITVISWQLAVSSHVELSVFNILGQKVATLVSEEQAAGNHKVYWDASIFPSGIYFYRIKAGKYHKVQKMILQR